MNVTVQKAEQRVEAEPANGVSSGPLSVLETIYARRSVRAYEPEPVGESRIRTLLTAAVQAPTAIHEEPWVFAVIQDQNRLKRLSDLAKPLFVEEVHRTHLDHGGHGLEMFASPDFNIFYNAGTLIVICGRPIGPFVVADCWLAAENLMLAACAMGLGTCVIGSAVPFLNSTAGKTELGIPAELSVVAPIILGVPGGETPATGRKAPDVAVWKQRISGALVQGDTMTTRETNRSSEPPLVCPVCGGPPLHPGDCLDHDGYVIPAYEELARIWEEQGRPELTAEELVDIDELVDTWGDEEHAES
jgi:nitroreductase